MKYKIETPVRGVSCKRAGLSFFKGKAETDDETKAQWFKSHGYIVTVQKTKTIKK